MKHISPVREPETIPYHWHWIRLLL